MPREDVLDSSEGDSHIEAQAKVEEKDKGGETENASKQDGNTEKKNAITQAIQKDAKGFKKAEEETEEFEPSPSDLD